MPVQYYLLTLTAPAEMRGVFLHYPQELYPTFFAAVSGALKALCARRKFLGGNIGFIAILHTWTRRMLFHCRGFRSSGAVMQAERAARAASPA